MSVEKLRVYRVACKLSDEIETAVGSLSPKLMKTHYDQATRAAESVTNNLSEGYGRSDKSWRQYVATARGSANERTNQMRALHRKTRSPIFFNLFKRSKDNAYRIHRLWEAIDARIKDEEED